MIGDDPVNGEGDLLGRRPIAQGWAAAIEDARSPSGLVFAITGPWGSGKTSMLTMVEEALRSQGVDVLHFNPWMFSGTDQLVTFFFAEIASQIGQTTDTKKQKVAGSLRKYGTYLTPLKAIPIIGTALGGAAQGAASIGAYMEEVLSRSITDRRKELEEGLRDLDRPVIVIVDDIDRLTGQEIRDVLRMVRLTAAFPNVIYLLSFDRQRVEIALQEDGIPGRAYLEKIVQVMFDVPVISRASLQRVLFDELNIILGDLGDEARFNVGLWADVYSEIIDPLIDNIRDVRRYVAPLRPVISILNNDVELVDVLALEAVRIFLPDSFAALMRSTEGLTSTEEYRGSSQEALKKQVIDFVESDPAFENVLRRVCERLFLASVRHLSGSRYGSDWEKTWLRARRVSSGAVLTYYLEKSVPEAVRNASRAEAAFALIEESDALEGTLNALGPDEAEAAIAALEGHEANFGGVDPRPGVTVLLNQLPRLKRPAKGMLDFGSTLVVTRVVLRLLRGLGDESSVGAAVTSIMPEVRTFYGQYQLLEIVGHTPDAGHRLMSSSEWGRLVDELRSRIRQGSAAQLAHEPGLLELLVWASIEEDPPAWEVPETHQNTPGFAAALLLDSFRPIHYQNMTSRHVTRRPALAWDLLSSIVGGEQGIRRLRSSASQELQEDSAILSLVDQYLSGWRPSDPSDR